MSIIKFEPVRDLETLSQRLQRYFEDFPAFGSEMESSFYPRIDISEDEQSLMVEAEIPGTKKEDIKITLEDNILTIKGEKKREEQKKDHNYYRNERCYGAFTRSFTLPVEVNPDEVEANFEHGMLTLKLAKLQVKPSNTKVIEVK
jgi:HSP20 family protein